MFRRRDFVFTALAAVVAAPCAFAQSGFPGKPITMLVGAAPGGTTDLAARMIADPLGAALGQPVVVENRAGANGAIAAVAVKRAPPDGHTLLMQYSGYHVISPHLVKGAPQKSISIFDTAIAAHFKHGRSISGRGMFLIPRSYPETETGAMKPLPGPRGRWRKTA